MSSGNEGKKGGRFGCLKLTCGGCLCLLIMAVFAGLAAWHALSRWDRGQSAWEHLPPAALWAVEGHDIGSLLGKLAEEPLLLALADRQARTLARSSGAGDIGESIRAASEAYRHFTFLHPVLLPNIATVGGTGERGETFAILKPPAWMRWTGDLPDEGAGAGRRPEFGGSGWYGASVEGWLVLAASESMLNEILANWRAAAKPLGPAPGRDDAYLAVGFRTSAARPPSGAGAPAAPEAGGLMLNDPFAAGGDDEYAGAGGKGGAAVRLIILPEAGGWSVEGGARFADANLSAPTAGGAGRGAPAIPRARPPAGRDARLDADIDPEFLDAVRERLAAVAGNASPATDSPWKALGWLWLNDAWLARVSGRLTLLAASPAAPADDAVAPLPVFSLGWTWAPDVDPRTAAEEFGGALTLWLESLTGPGGAAPLAVLRNRIHAENRPDGGVSGSVDLPPVLANHARPAWLLWTAPSPAGGWLASDPAGLPAGDAARELAQGRGGPAPAPSRSSASATWELSDSFRSSLMAVLRERLELFSPDAVPQKSAILQALEYVDAVLKVYPSGRASAEYEEEGGALRFGGRMQTGAR